MLTDKQHSHDFFDRMAIILIVVAAGTIIGAATARMAELCMQWFNL